MNQLHRLNRLHTSQHPCQGEFKKVLCVCSAGINRSPTAALVLSGPPFNFNTRAAGVHSQWCLIPIDEVLVWWADEIVFMEESHVKLIEHMIPQETQTIILDIPDNHMYRSIELQQMIADKYKEVTKWEAR